MGTINNNNNNNVCGYLPFTTSTNCSNNGICQQDGTCLCNPGWTGLSDWVSSQNSLTGKDYDCQINITAMKALWSIQIIVYSLVLLKSIPTIYSAIKRHRDFQKQSKAKGREKQRGYLENGVLVTLFIFAGICTPLSIAFAVLEITTSNRFGIDWGITIIFLIWRSCFVLTANSFQPYILMTVVGNTGKASRDIVVKAKFVSKVIFIVFGCVGLIVIAAPLTQSDPVPSLIAYNVALTVSLLAQALQARHIKIRVSEVLDASYKSTKKDSILEVKENLTRVQTTIIIQTSLMSFMYIIQCIPFFWNKLPYFIPIAMTFPCGLYINAVRTVSQNSTKRQRTNSESARDLRSNSSVGGNLPRLASKQGSKANMSSARQSTNNLHGTSDAKNRNSIDIPTSSTNQSSTTATSNNVQGRIKPNLNIATGAQSTNNDGDDVVIQQQIIQVNDEYEDDNSPEDVVSTTEEEFKVKPKSAASQLTASMANMSIPSPSKMMSYIRESSAKAFSPRKAGKSGLAKQQSNAFVESTQENKKDGNDASPE